MRAKLFIILITVFFSALSVVSWAVENPSVRNPVGPATVPPSSLRSGLIRSPNPIDRTSNLVVTGNIGGGRHFRGIVPYNAVSDFGGRLGSTTLDSFLRRSAGTEYYGQYTGKLVPYYSQTGTVTIARPGLRGVLRQPVVGVGERTAETIDLLTQPRAEELSGSEASSFFKRSLVPYLIVNRESEIDPMLLTPKRLEEITSESKISEQRRVGMEQTSSAAKSTLEVEQFRRKLEQISEKTSELERKLLVEDKSLQPATKPELEEDVLRPESVIQGKYTERDDVGMQEEIFGVLGKEFDVYEQMKRQIDRLQKGVEYLPDLQEGKKGVEIGEKPEEEQAEEKSQMEKISEVSLTVSKAQTIMGEHKTFASFSEDKFNKHMRAGERYLKEGKYYWAADAYTLASIYKPNDPLAYAGKSHALLAAGEYMSSALFLSRALVIFPEYARFKIDIEGMLGDKDKIESRVVDIEKWLETSDAGELHFLLSYVYYHMGKLERAKKSIDAAYEKIPEAPAVITLREVIYDVIR